MDKQEYKEYVEGRMKKSPILKNCFHAFLMGGAICTLGQAFLELYMVLGVERATASTLASITLIFLAILLTGLGVFDNIARLAGAGTIVPITGFANSVASSALDTKSEGYVLGVGAKIFTIAGPVILFGTMSGALYGVIYYLVTALGG